VGIIDPGGISKAGNAAHHAADTMVKPAYGELGSAETDEGGSKLGGFGSKDALDSLIGIWQPTTDGLRGNVHTVGDKLLTTSTTYVSTDNAAVDPFKYVIPRFANGKPIPE
jgi:hypothetical protein